MTTFEETEKVLQNNPIFSELSAKDIAMLASLVKKITVEPGQFIVREGDESTDVYLIEEGEVEILKKEETSDRMHQLSTLQKGDVFGEVALLDSAPRSASVRALTSGHLFMLPLHKLRTLADNQMEYAKLAIRLAQSLTKRIRLSNQNTIAAYQREIESAQARVQAGRFIINVLILLATYVFTMHAIDTFFNPHLRRLLTTPILIVAAVVVLMEMRLSGYPLSFYGLSLKNWKKHAIESIYFSVFFMLFALVSKWVLIHTIPAFTDRSLFQFTLGVKTHFWQSTDWSSYIITPIIYLIFIPVQELICRGGLQSSLANFTIGPHKKIWSIVISNLLFSLFHLNISFALAIGAFVSGLFWGWMYARQGTLVGVTISHAIIGLFMFFGLDFLSFFQ